MDRSTIQMEQIHVSKKSIGFLCDDVGENGPEAH